jgi:hypothetical protein
MPEKNLQLVLALRSLAAFHIGLGVSTTVRLVRTEGREKPSCLPYRPGRVDYRAPGAYEGRGRPGLAGRRYLRAAGRELLPLFSRRTCLCAHPLGTQKNLSEMPGLSFFLVVTPQGYFEGRRLIGHFFLIWAELRYKARGKPKNDELGGFA